MSVFLLLTVCLFLQVIVSSVVNINHTICYKMISNYSHNWCYQQVTVEILLPLELHTPEYILTQFVIA